MSQAATGVAAPTAGPAGTAVVPTSADAGAPAPADAGGRGLAGVRRAMPDHHALASHGGTVLVVGVDPGDEDVRPPHRSAATMRAAANALRGAAPVDAEVTSLGGGVLAVAVPRATDAAGLEVAQRLRDVLRAAMVVVDDLPADLSVRVGVSHVAAGTDARGLDDAIDGARDALGAARTSGVGIVCDPGRLRDTDPARSSVRRRLRDALDGDGLTLLVQPIIDLATDEVTAYELLVRLDDGHGPRLEPAEFLPIAERSTLATTLDRWVVRRAVELLASPRGRRRNLRLQVNLTGRTLGHAAFADELIAQLNRAGVDPGRLGVEVSEAAALRDGGGVSRLVRGLRGAGCPVVLDDFGSGVGSLQALQHAQYAAVKVSGPLVDRADRSPRDRTVVEGMVRLARGLGMQVIAEDVDRPGLLDALRDTGIRGAQGFLLGAPHPLDQVMARLR